MTYSGPEGQPEPPYVPSAADPAPGAHIPEPGTPLDSAAAAPTAVRQARPGLDGRGRVRGTRVSALWVGLIVAAILLIALLIFIAQNSRTVTIHYLGARGHISLAVAILMAAVAGVLLVAIPGTARIVQLRRALRKTHR